MCKPLDILVVEDDVDINNLLREILEKNSYNVTLAYSGSEGLLIIKSRCFDLVLLDLMLPGLSGEQLVSEIRKITRIPVIIISAKDAPESKIKLLKYGADDYITKPFDTGELLARVEANLRRSLEYGPAGREIGKTVEYKGIVLDTETREVKVEGSPVPLTAREYAILEILMKHPKKVFTKQNLFESVWEDAYLGDENTVNVHISNLRGKLSKTRDYIQTVWGIGYKMSE